MKMTRGLFFFCLSLFETTKIGLDLYGGGGNQELENFLTSLTFDCTPGYAPGNK